MISCKSVYRAMMWLLIATFATCVYVDAHAQEFFKAKTIRIIVGFAPGGGFHTYSRTIPRHMANHIPNRQCRSRWGLRMGLDHGQGVSAFSVGIR